MITRIYLCTRPNIRLEYEANIRLGYEANVRLEYEANIRLGYEANVRLEYEANIRLGYNEANIRFEYEANTRLGYEANIRLEYTDTEAQSGAFSTSSFHFPFCKKQGKNCRAHAERCIFSLNHNQRAVVVHSRLPAR